ncbi:MAG: thiamine pyrophosphate-binding protein [Candidatus Bathyarchaeia archaeon]
MKAVRYLVEQCQTEGIKYMFGVQGGHISPLFNEVLDSQITTIMSRHEQGASLEATGYAWATGVAQMCVGTVGPGAVNLISGLHPAYQNSQPVLAIVANNKASVFGKMATQDASGWGPRTISQLDMSKSVTKWSTLVFNAEVLPEALRRAFRIMYSGRPGPVLLDICFDAFFPEVSDNILPPYKYRPMCRIRGDPEYINKAAKLLVNAQRPAILAGGGVQISQATPELLELSEILSIPVATTMMGKSCFPEDHTLAMGVTGAFGHDIPARILRKGQTDVLLALGTVFHDKSTYGWVESFGGDMLIQVDIDPAEIGKNYPVDVGIVGDIKLVLRDLVDCVKNLLLTMPSNERNHLENMKRERVERLLALKNETRYYSELPMFSDAVPIKPQRVMKELRDFLEKDAIVFTDCGNNMVWVERYFQTYFPRTFIVDGAHTSMGASIPMSIGAKLGFPDRQVVAVLGNGGFHMLCKEVVTASSYSIPVVWIILDDNALGMIAHVVCKFGYGIWEPDRYVASGPGLYDMDFVKFAEACHVYGQRVEKPGEIKDALKNAFDSGKPAIIDVVIDPDEIPPGSITKFKKVIDSHPGLLERKMKRSQFPQKAVGQK